MNSRNKYRVGVFIVFFSYLLIKYSFGMVADRLYLPFTHVLLGFFLFLALYNKIAILKFLLLIVSLNHLRAEFFSSGGILWSNYSSYGEPLYYFYKVFYDI